MGRFTDGTHKSASTFEGITGVGVGLPKERRDGRKDPLDAPGRIDCVHGGTSLPEVLEDRHRRCRMRREAFSDDPDGVVRSSRVLGAFEQSPDPVALCGTERIVDG